VLAPPELDGAADQAGDAARQPRPLPIDRECAIGVGRATVNGVPAERDLFRSLAFRLVEHGYD
jgi:hypothetical protein